MEPQIQYVKTEDGVSIAFWTMGQGGVPLIMSPPLGWSHISLEHRFPELRAWYERLAATRLLVRYDERNQGLSQRGIEKMSEADFARDVEAVLERLGLDQADLWTLGSSAPPLLRVAAEHSDVVRRLVLWNPYLRGRDELSHPRMRTVISLIESDWELFTETFTGNYLRWSGDDAHEWARFIRRAVTQEDAARLFAATFEFDATQWLERISAPTLVVHDRLAGDQSESAQMIAAGIRNARLLQLGGREPLFRSETGMRAIEEFLDEGQTQPKPDLPSGTAIILFTDIVDSTALTEQLGDSAFRDRARELDASLRTVIREHDGTPIEGKLLGDGVLAVFTSARQAIEAALACGVAGESCGLPLHLGVHAGDVIREEGNVFGGAVNVAARIADASAPGELLVSQTVRDLARTSAGVSFEERGERELKGVGEPVRIWAVRAHRSP
jgi:class 3 adenylate cyclase